VLDLARDRLRRHLIEGRLFIHKNASVPLSAVAMVDFGQNRVVKVRASA
jgi:hypothetical protein